MVLKIRKAKNKDREQVLAFCQNTFSWGDYIHNVWDLWLNDGKFLLAERRNKPIGICHASFSKNQIWIEGLRVNPEFRRKGYASKMILDAERTAKKNDCNISRMLIAQENIKSLKLARSLGYYVEGKWWLYYVSPKKQISKARVAKKIKNLESEIFSESWKWYQLDKQTISRLIKNRQVVTCGDSVGIWNKSKIDSDVIQIGYLRGTKSEISEILKYVQNIGYKLKPKRIQILAQDTIKLNGKGIDKRMLFCLLRKDL